jgi:hypothetical protein
MPEISRFFGIIITMYYNDHAPPHFHARYGRQKGRFEIESLAMLDGNLSPRTKNLVLDWAKQHQEELRREWALASGRQPLFKIEPLE